MFSHIKEFFTRPSGGYTISRSVRLRNSASAYLSRNMSTTSTTTWTASFWYKTACFDTYTAVPSIFQSVETTGAGRQCGVDANTGTTGQIQFYKYTAPTYAFKKVPSMLFRDPSAWYHIVFVWNTTVATAEDRAQIWVNGTRVTSWAVNTTPTQNETWLWSMFTNSFIGAQNRNNGTVINPFDGLITEFNFVDGQALTASSFGETNAVTGVWQPKKYAGTYGTNGFYLNFSDNSSNTATTIGKDYSGNGNNWTPNNISVTAGVTYDSMVDSPTVGATSSNYAVMNPNDQAGGLVFADGNLKVTAATGWDGSRATFSLPSTGKYYWEATCISRATGAGVGVLSTSAVITGDLGAAATGYIYNSGDGNKYNNNSGSAYGATWGTNDIIGIAWNADAGTLSFYKNGTSQGNAYTSLSGTFSPAIGVNGSDSMAANFGQRPFSYTPPTGFVALNTQNLPTPTISNGAVHMDVALQTGTGADAAFPMPNGMAPDFAWLKSRSNATNQVTTNRLTTNGQTIYTNTTGAEIFNASLYFGGNDMRMQPYFADAGQNGQTYVLWGWKAGGGTGVTNTSGSITSTVSANPTAGFSIVLYTGTGANATIGHGLGVAPKMIIVFNRSGGYNHAVYNSNIGATNYLYLDTTSASSVASSLWNNTTPTSSVFSIGTSGAVNNGNGYVAYCFAEVAGYSAFGSYTGNGSTDGTFVYTGFRPRFILIKESTPNARGWRIFDTSRNTYNQAGLTLSPNSSDAEDSGSGLYNQMDILSNGFKLRAGTNSEPTNESGATYIYACFAENPFKYSLAR
jgi:hypothetical protein